MRSILITFTVLFLTTLSVAGQGIEFYHGTWEEAILKAKAEDKIIFVDAYTTWCGPCKRMAASTFPDQAVGELFNQHFLSLKIDMEKEMGLEFKKKFPVNAYPTLFFIDYDQVLIRQAVGAKSPADLIALGESIIAKYDKSTKYEAAYASGDRSYQLVYDYVAALNKSGKPSVKIANDYLLEEKDLTTPENLKFILEAASQVDCQCFDLFEQYRSNISKVVSEETINAKVRQACNNTVKRAIEFESPELIGLAAYAMKRNIPSEADRFRSDSEIKYALALHDLSRIQDLVNSHVRKFIKNDPASLNQMALDLDKYAADDQTCRLMAIDLAGKAAKEKDATAAYITTYANLVYKTNGKAEAVKILDEALHKIGDPENKDYQNLKALKNKIENS
ncbi:MAG: thioredoxin domain-containing protein [Saprospiraceae bacterium]|nr:thioredoxin domain-containing protein [Saprospiraceae bacterium]